MKKLEAWLYGCAFACITAVAALGCGGGDVDSEADLDLEEDAPEVGPDAWQMEEERDLELPGPGPIEAAGADFVGDFERRRVMAESIDGQAAEAHH